MPKARYVILLTLAYLAVAVGGGYYMWATGKLSRGAGEDDPVRIARGEAVYVKHCAACHGLDLKGQPDWQTKLADGTLPPPPQDQSGHTWQHGDGELFDYIRDGGAAHARGGFKSAMPSFEAVLGNAEIWAVIAYVKSRWPEDIRAKQRRTSFLNNIHHH
ncbi:MAG: cytochrome c [Rhodospirillales bacterium]|nr:cytochrome c [Rhodospirillales bacterium]